MAEPLRIGAFAAVQYVDTIQTFLATGVGEFDGPIWAQATSPIPDLAGGTGEFTMRHEFMNKDGSRLSTTDVATAVVVPGTGKVSLTVQHTVIGATGRWAGRTGTFPSFGLHDFATGEGVQRFGGTLD
jgi:hypothetical protein